MRVIAILLACLLSSPAWALCDLEPVNPKSCEKPGKLDPHMVTAAYDPAQVYALHIPQGQTLAVTLAPDEIATDGFGADKTLLLSDLSGNVVLYNAGSEPVPPRTLFIRSRSLDGTRTRTYSFLADTKPASDAMSSFTFTYPADDYARRVAAWKQAQAQREQKAVVDDLERTRVGNDSNVKYVLQGEKLEDWDLLPTRQVSDNGTDTHFFFPGNMRVPIIYALNPDGKEAVVEPTFNSRTGIATMHQLSRVFHLRDGDALLCVYNHAFDPIGVRSQTGTDSPDIERVTK
jgi:type IV secretion system protein VirB9